MESGLRSVRQRRPLDARRRVAGCLAARPDRVGQGEGASRRGDRAGRCDTGRDFPVHNAGRLGAARCGPWRSRRLLPHRVDRPQRNLSLPPYCRDRRVRHIVSSHRRRHPRSAASVAAHRVCFRRVFRRRLRLRHAGRGDRRNSDRPWFLTACGFRTFADRQYCAGRIWCARYADRRASQRHRIGSLCARRHGWATAAVLFRAVSYHFG